MFFSVTQDILVSQPLKVVGLAIFFALIFKKNNKSNLFLPFNDYARDQLPTTTRNLGQEHAVAPTVKVPTETILQLAREKAAKERAMHAILLDFGTYILFTLIVLLIAYGIRDQDSFHQNNAVVKVVLSHNFYNHSEGSEPHVFSEVILYLTVRQELWPRDYVAQLVAWGSHLKSRGNSFRVSPVQIKAAVLVTCSLKPFRGEIAHEY